MQVSIKIKQVRHHVFPVSLVLKITNLVRADVQIALVESFVQVLTIKRQFVVTVLQVFIKKMKGKHRAFLVFLASLTTKQDNKVVNNVV
jgi:hypothetical protein